MLPIINIGVLIVWIDELVLCVRFWPELDGEFVKIGRTLAIGERELEESIACLRAEDNELGQALQLQIFAHEKTVVLRAVDLRYDIVESA